MVVKKGDTYKAVEQQQGNSISIVNSLLSSGYTVVKVIDADSDSDAIKKCQSIIYAPPPSAVIYKTSAGKIPFWKKDYKLRARDVLLMCLFVYGLDKITNENTDQNTIKKDIPTTQNVSTTDDKTSSEPSPSLEDLNELTATILNVNGLLCADVTDIHPLKVRENVYEVTCIQYRGGSGKKTYIMDILITIEIQPALAIAVA